MEAGSNPDPAALHGLLGTGELTAKRQIFGISANDSSGGMGAVFNKLVSSSSARSLLTAHSRQCQDGSESPTVPRDLRLVTPVFVAELAFKIALLG